ncbi:FliG C-terminal domain-containing protein [Candidatus Terasakiella magnetica]|nr:FliG C-terminal domain-containing protein [Candidatus Terasakiella magnetica]
MVYTLKGDSEEVKDLFFKNMSECAAKMMGKDLEGHRACSVA